ncbi:UNVERIFIED_CONTAM: hypothetical protein FKN15_038443 [Acipenser sinensis]
MRTIQKETRALHVTFFATTLYNQIQLAKSHSVGLNIPPSPLHHLKENKSICSEI